MIYKIAIFSRLAIHVNGHVNPIAFDGPSRDPILTKSEGLKLGS